MDVETRRGRLVGSQEDLETGEGRELLSKVAGQQQLAVHGPEDDSSSPHETGSLSVLHAQSLTPRRSPG